MRVLAVEPFALASCIDESGSTSEVMIDLVGDVAPGDTVLVHAGVAIALTGSGAGGR
jgi:hydrogenase maturation factor